MKGWRGGCWEARAVNEGGWVEYVERDGRMVWGMVVAMAGKGGSDGVGGRRLRVVVLAVCCCCWTLLGLDRGVNNADRDA